MFPVRRSWLLFLAPAAMFLNLLFTSPAQGTNSKEGALAPLVEYLGRDRDLALVSWKPVNFEKAVRAGFTSVWIGNRSFLQLSERKQQKLLDEANGAGLRVLGLIGGEPSWANPRLPNRKEHVRKEYRALTARLSQKRLGRLKIGFATDIEPYTQNWWDGDLGFYSDLIQDSIAPIVRKFSRRHPGRVLKEIRRFEAFWYENGHVSRSRMLRNLRDFPSVVASMTYRNNPVQLESVSERVRRRARQASGLRYLLGAETKPAGRGIPPHITFHGQLDQISFVFIQTMDGFSDEDWKNLAGIFIHAGKAEVDRVLDALLKISPASAHPYQDSHQP